MASPSQKYRFEGEMNAEKVGQLDEMLEDLYTYLSQSPLGTAAGAFDISELVDTGLLYADADDALASFDDVGVLVIGADALPDALSAATGSALISGGVDTVPSFGKIGLTTHVSGILPIANGGTNKDSFTTGSVIYFDGTRLQEDNSGLFFDASNKRLGIGVASPTNALDVRGTSPILGGFYSDTAGFSALRFFEGTTLRSSVQQIGSTFATAGRRDDLELVTIGATGDIVFRPQDTETARFAPGGLLTLTGTIKITGGSPGANKVLTSDANGLASWETPSASGMEIGGTITDATQGSVLFAGASGVLAQDNANLFWDDTNNRLGIGTAAPDQQLHVLTSGGRVVMSGTSYTDVAGEATQYRVERARGTLGTPAALDSGDDIGDFNFRGYHDGGAFGEGGHIIVEAAEDWTSLARGTNMLFQNNNIGATGSSTRLSLLAAGHMRLPELTGDPSTSVLSSLAEMAIYMKNNKFVIAYNNAGAITYISIPMNGSTTTWTHSTTAP